MAHQWSCSSGQMVIPCGMDRGVVPLAPVAPSTHHHGSMYTLPSPTTDYIEVRICTAAGYWKTCSNTAHGTLCEMNWT